MVAVGAAVIAYSPFVLLLAVWIGCCQLVRSSTRRLMWFAALLVLSLAYFWYTMPRLAEGVVSAAAGTTGSEAVRSAPGAAASAYRKYVDDMGGTRMENRGNVEALMAKQQRIERTLFEGNRASNPQFARHVDQLQAMGMPSHTLQSMGTSIHGDLQESLMADRNVGALKPQTMTAPSVVGQFARSEEMVPQQRGDSLARATGLTDQLLPGPKATTTTDGLAAIQSDEKKVLSEAAKSGIMAAESGDGGGGGGLEAVFSASAAAGEDADSAELLAAAVSAAEG